MTSPLVAALLAATALAQDTPPPPPPPAPPPAPAQEPKPGDTPKPADPAKPEGPPKPPPTPSRPVFTGSADDLAAKFPAVVRVSEYGRSANAKPLRLVTVSAARDAEIDWETLVVAHLSGLRPADETALALDVAARLAERAADVPPRVAFRFAIDASPDAVSRAGNATPTDDDQDGEIDEDGPDDVDGDGRIGWMRFPDPAGDFAADDPAKPGAAPERADAAKGKPAAWRIVPEGRDDDGDGQWNEDGKGGADVSRNFTAFFEEHVPATGRWAASEPESRALMDLLLADERIAAVYEIGSAETIAAAPEWGVAWPKLPDDDIKLVDGLRTSHAAGAIPIRKARAPGAGSLAATVWHQLGRLWLGRASVGRSGLPWPAAGAEWPANESFAWKDVSGSGLPPGAQVASPFQGTVDRSGPSVQHETDSIADFLLVLAKGRAQLGFAQTTTSGEPGVLRLETRLVNSGRLPTATQRGAEVKGRRPLNLWVRLPDGASLLAGKALTQIERIAGGAQSDPMRWVVRGPSGATVKLECVGPDTGTTTLEVRMWDPLESTCRHASLSIL